MVLSVQFMPNDGHEPTMFGSSKTSVVAPQPSLPPLLLACNSVCV